MALPFNPSDVFNGINAVRILTGSKPKPENSSRVQDYDRLIARLDDLKNSMMEQPVREPEAVLESSAVEESFELPTTDETIQDLKRRLGKELYRIELDLQSGGRIAGKPCGCLCEKHNLGIEATIEELIGLDKNPVYSEILRWFKDHEPQFCPTTSQPPEYYHSLTPEVRAFRKSVMGTETLRALLSPSAVAQVERQAQRVRQGEITQEEGISELEESLPKVLGRVDWMPQKKVWRIIWFEGSKDIPKGDYATKQEAEDKLRELIRAKAPVTPEVTKLIGDTWNRMTPIEREQLGIKAKLDDERRGARWIELFPEEKRALIREFKKDPVALPKAESAGGSIIITRDKVYPRPARPGFAWVWSYTVSSPGEYDASGTADEVRAIAKRRHTKTGLPIIDKTKELVPNAEAAQEITGKLVTRSYRTPVGIVVDFGIRIGDTVYEPRASAVSPIGISEAKKGWSEVSAKDRENYRGWEKKQGAFGNRARAIVDIERRWDEIIAKGKTSQEHAKEQLASYESYIKRRAEAERRYSLKSSGLIVGMTLEEIATGDRYVITEITDEGSVYARPENEPTQSGGSIGKGEVRGYRLAIQRAEAPNAEAVTPEIAGRKFIGVTKSTEVTQLRTAPWRVAYEYKGKEYAGSFSSRERAVAWAKEKLGVDLDPKTLEPIIPASPKAKAGMAESAKEPWQMSREELLSKVAGEIGYTGVSPRNLRDVNIIVRESVHRNNELQRQTNQMVARLRKQGKSSKEAWGIVEQSPEWKEFVSTKPDVNKFSNSILEHKQIVRQAISEGKPVPSSVLANYPDLATSALKPSEVIKTNPPILEGNLNSLAGNTKAISDFSKSETFSKQGFGGFDVPTQRLMFNRMLASLHQSEIRNAIIKTIPVDVVDKLIGIQLPANMVLHDPSVNKELLSILLDGSISLRTDTANTLIRRIASLTTKEQGGTAGAVGDTIKGLSAIRATDIWHNFSIAQSGLKGKPEVLKDYPDLAKPSYKMSGVPSAK